MPQETEGKFKIPDFRTVRRRLRTAGATYVGTVRQRDVFFDTPDRALYRSDQGLRLRESRLLKAGSGGLRTEALLTYKGPREAGSRMKSRREIQTEIADARSLAEILQAAGMKPFMTIEKRRASYTLGRCLVELDELPILGCFVEIEGAGERAINAVRRQLALDDAPITKTYLNLAIEICCHINNGCQEISFDSCRRCRR